MIANKKFFLLNNEKGSSLTEVLFAISIVVCLTPFMFNLINTISKNIKNIFLVKEITSNDYKFINFIKSNQHKWKEVSKIKLSELEIKDITKSKVKYVYIDKYKIKESLIIDAFLVFRTEEDSLNKIKILNKIGDNASIVNKEKIASSSSWSISSPDLLEGDIVYKITYSPKHNDNYKYLHRNFFNDKELNTMYTDLNMGGFNIYGINYLKSQSSNIYELEANILESNLIFSSNIYFNDGLNINNSSDIDIIKVSDDINSFNNIYVRDINDNLKSQIIANNLGVYNEMKILKNMNIKYDKYKNINNITSIKASFIEVPYLLSKRIYFNNCGINISSENIIIKNQNIVFGKWLYPQEQAPTVSNLKIDNIDIPKIPDTYIFNKILNSNWDKI